MTRDDYVHKAAERLRELTPPPAATVDDRGEAVSADLNLTPGPAYMYVHRELDIARTIEVSPTVHVDMDAHGRVWGIERIDGPVDVETLMAVIREIPQRSYLAGREDAARDIEAWSRGETQAWPPPGSLNECVEQAIAAARGQQPRGDAR